MLMNDEKRFFVNFLQWLWIEAIRKETEFGCHINSMLRNWKRAPKHASFQGNKLAIRPYGFFKGFIREQGKTFDFPRHFGFEIERQVRGKISLKTFLHLSFHTMTFFDEIFYVCKRNLHFDFLVKCSRLASCFAEYFAFQIPIQPNTDFEDVKKLLGSSSTFF